MAERFCSIGGQWRLDECRQLKLVSFAVICRGYDAMTIVWAAMNTAGGAALQELWWGLYTHNRLQHGDYLFIRVSLSYSHFQGSTLLLLLVVELLLATS